MRRVLLSCLLLCAVAAPVAAYTIYLKDGSRLIARDKYTVEGVRALITLENGTRTFIAASEIDAPRTEEANRGNYGTAMELEDGKVRELGTTKPPPAKAPTISEMVRQGQGPDRDRPPARRPIVQATPGGTTPGGAVDLATLSRAPWTELDLVAELRQFFRGQGLEDVGVYRGTDAAQPLLEVTTSSEASVFRALATGAVALRELRTRHGDRLRGLDLLLTTGSRERAGQFRISAQMAEDLVSKRIEISQFYVRYLQF